MATVLVMALLRLLADIPSAYELISDRLGGGVPADPLVDLVGLVGSFGRLKTLSAFVMLAATLALGAALGAEYAMTRPAVVVGVVAAAWVILVLALWPVLRVPSAAALLGCGAVYV
ncbi:MAG: hypothetical protein ACRD12_23850, partial [Acidimicrobiales bacterium]